MASVHKNSRGKSPYWFVSYRLPNGRQRTRSTKETDRTKAEAIAAAIEASQGKHKIGSLTETTARTIIAGVVEELTGNKLKFTSIKEWFDSCLANIQKKRGATTHKRYSAVIRDLLEFIGPKRAAAPVESLEADEVQRFADGRIEEGRAVKTVSNDLKPISSFLKKAESQGLLLKSPMGKVELPEIDGETRDPFSETELTALLDYLSASTTPEGTPLHTAQKTSRRDWRTAVTVGLLTGARLGDCANMRWSNVDYGRKEIRFIPEKNRRKRELVVPMHRDLEAYLLTLSTPDKADSFLAPTLGGAAAGERCGLSKSFGAILDDAGIDRRQGKKKKGVGRTFFKLGFHSLRHTCNSAMANAGVSQELRTKLIGHSSAAMNDKYTHLSSASKRHAIEAIPSIKR